MNSLIAFQAFDQYGKLNLNPHTLPKPDPTPASTPLHPTSTSPAGVTGSLNQVFQQPPRILFVPSSPPELNDVHHFPPLFSSSPLTPTFSALNYRGGLLSAPKVKLFHPHEVTCTSVKPSCDTVSDAIQRPVQNTADLTSSPMKKPVVRRCRNRSIIHRSCNVMVYDP